MAEKRKMDYTQREVREKGNHKDEAALDGRNKKGRV